MCFLQVPVEDTCISSCLCILNSWLSSVLVPETTISLLKVKYYYTPEQLCPQQGAVPPYRYSMHVNSMHLDHTLIRPSQNTDRKLWIEKHTAYQWRQLNNQFGKKTRHTVECKYTWAQDPESSLSKVQQPVIRRKKKNQKS